MITAAYFAIGIGIGLALAGGVLAAIVGFDRERSFYPTVLLAIGSYYVLFAVQGAALDVLPWEIASFLLFGATAVLGFRTSPWIVVVGLGSHGLYDATHGHFLANPGVPTWWPTFCAAFDVTAAACLALSIRKSRSGLTVLVERELADFRTARGRNSRAEAWRALERAHIVSQAALIPHARVHILMLGYGLEQRDPREAMGQIFRLILLPVGHALRRLPVGNTGRANVSAFAPMPLPEDLADGSFQVER